MWRDGSSMYENTVFIHCKCGDLDAIADRRFFLYIQVQIFGKHSKSHASRKAEDKENAGPAYVPEAN